MHKSGYHYMWTNFWKGTLCHNNFGQMLIHVFNCSSFHKVNEIWYPRRTMIILLDTQFHWLPEQNVEWRAIKCKQIYLQESVFLLDHTSW